MRHLNNMLYGLGFVLGYIAGGLYYGPQAGFRTVKSTYEIHKLNKMNDKAIATIATIERLS